MKKLIISAVCGLSLLGAFTFVSQDKTVNEVAISRYSTKVRV